MMLQHLQVNILMVEYRGYGESDTVTPNEKGLKLDAEAALQYCLNHPKIDNNLIYVFGRSLGGAVAFHLAGYAQRKGIPLAGVIVENTFSSISSMVDHLMPFLRPIKSLVLNIGWDSTVIVPSLTTPLLFLSGSADTLVPPEHMQKLVQLSKQSTLVRVHIIAGGTHNESWIQGGAAYWNAIVHFLGESRTANNPSQARMTTTTTTTSSAAASDVSSAQNSIPTMPSRFVDIAKDAVKKKE
jgi:fermentation-respiration switch protein FrsA (DUF1100 family)